MKVASVRGWRWAMALVAGLGTLAGCQGPMRWDLPEPQVTPMPTWTPHPLPVVVSEPAAVSDPPPVAAPVSPEEQVGWAPPAMVEDLFRWEGIIIHHSAVPDQGSAADLDRFHKGRGFDGLGYDFVICNGRGAPDGRIDVGWRWTQQREGAHCRVEPGDNNYWNEHTIGIVLVGDFEVSQPTPAQYESLARLVRFLQDRYHIPADRIMRHCDIKDTKCPGRFFSMQELQKRLAAA
jgi:hypothetical protein